MKRSGLGFSLVELLSVIAIIAILAGLLIPAVVAVRNHARRVQSRAMFQQFAVGLESFRQKYGYYPDLSASATARDIAFSLDSDVHDLFIEVLSGRGPQGGDLSSTGLRFNWRRIPFYTFAEGDFDEGGRISDAFGNRDIKVFLDADENGFIAAELMRGNFVDSEGLPRLADDYVIPKNVRGRVLIMSPGNGGRFLKSWE